MITFRLVYTNICFHSLSFILKIPFDLFVYFCLDCARADARKVNIDKTICFFCGFSIDRDNIADVWVAAEKCNLRTLKIAVYHHLVRPPHKLRDPFFIQATSQLSVTKTTTPFRGSN